MRSSPAGLEQRVPNGGSDGSSLGPAEPFHDVASDSLDRADVGDREILKSDTDRVGEPLLAHMKVITSAAGRIGQ